MMMAAIKTDKYYVKVNIRWTQDACVRTESELFLRKQKRFRSRYLFLGVINFTATTSCCRFGYERQEETPTMASSIWLQFPKWNKKEQMGMYIIPEATFSRDERDTIVDLNGTMSTEETDVVPAIKDAATGINRSITQNKACGKEGKMIDDEVDPIEVFRAKMSDEDKLLEGGGTCTDCCGYETKRIANAIQKFRSKMEIEAGKPVQIEKKDTIDILGVNQGIDWATATISCQPKLEQLLEEDPAFDTADSLATFGGPSDNVCERLNQTTCVELGLPCPAKLTDEQTVDARVEVETEYSQIANEDEDSYMDSVNVPAATDATSDIDHAGTISDSELFDDDSTWDNTVNTNSFCPQFGPSADAAADAERNFSLHEEDVHKDEIEKFREEMQEEDKMLEEANESTTSSPPLTVCETSVSSNRSDEKLHADEIFNPNRNLEDSLCSSSSIVSASQNEEAKLHGMVFLDKAPPEEVTVEIIKTQHIVSGSMDDIEEINSLIGIVVDEVKIAINNSDPEHFVNGNENKSDDELSREAESICQNNLEFEYDIMTKEDTEILLMGKEEYEENSQVDDLHHQSEKAVSNVSAQTEPSLEEDIEEAGDSNSVPIEETEKEVVEPIPDKAVYDGVTCALSHLDKRVYDEVTRALNHMNKPVCDDVARTLNHDLSERCMEARESEERKDDHFDSQEGVLEPNTRVPQDSCDSSGKGDGNSVAAGQVLAVEEAKVTEDHQEPAYPPVSAEIIMSGEAKAEEDYQKRNLILEEQKLFGTCLDDEWSNPFLLPCNFIGFPVTQELYRVEVDSCDLLGLEDSSFRLDTGTSAPGEVSIKGDHHSQGMVHQDTDAILEQGSLQNNDVSNILDHVEQQRLQDEIVESVGKKRVGSPIPVEIVEVKRSKVSQQNTFTVLDQAPQEPLAHGSDRVVDCNDLLELSFNPDKCIEKIRAKTRSDEGETESQLLEDFAAPGIQEDDSYTKVYQDETKEEAASVGSEQQGIEIQLEKFCAVLRDQIKFEWEDKMAQMRDEIKAEVQSNVTNEMKKEIEAEKIKVDDMLKANSELDVLKESVHQVLHDQAQMRESMAQNYETDSLQTSAEIEVLKETVRQVVQDQAQIRESMAQTHDEDALQTSADLEELKESVYQILDDQAQIRGPMANNEDDEETMGVSEEHFPPVAQDESTEGLSLLPILFPFLVTVVPLFLFFRVAGHGIGDMMVFLSSPVPLFTLGFLAPLMAYLESAGEAQDVSEIEEGTDMQQVTEAETAFDQVVSPSTTIAKSLYTGQFPEESPSVLTARTLYTRQYGDETPPPSSPTKTKTIYTGAY